MIKTVCEKQYCTGCRACELICPRQAIRMEFSAKNQQAMIDSDKCIGCNLCRKVCQALELPEMHDTVECKQGWSIDQKIRKKASSGGIATMISKEFIKNGGVVAGCKEQNGRFLLALAETEDELEGFIGSKYLKSDTSDIYSKVQEKLSEKKKVLFIGLPCQVAGLKKYLGNNTDKLYTIDLVCHGAPSQYLLEMFLKQYRINLEEVKGIKFREKDRFHLSFQDRKFVSVKVLDNYTRGFLKGLFYTDNCYACRYAKEARVGDMTIGDAWGSELDSNEVKAGISMALIQTKKGAELANTSGITLQPFDYTRAKAYNRQLERPSACPAERERFFEMIEKNATFNHAILACYPAEVAKGLLKERILWIMERKKYEYKQKT